MSNDRMKAILNLLERLPVPVVIASPVTAKVLWVNSRQVKMAGATHPDQLVGRTLFEFMSASQISEGLRDLAKVALGQSPPPVVYELKGVDGSAAAGHIASIPMMYYGQPAMLSLVTDVTEKERVLRELSESEERYRMLVDHSPSGLVVVDGSTEAIVYANPALVRALGYQFEDELLERSMYDFIPPKDRTSIRESRRSVLQTGRLATSGLTLVRADGTRLHTEAVSTRVQWNGEPATQTLMHDLGGTIAG